MIGNFGTYGDDMRRLLRQVLPPLLLAGHEDRVGVLIGRNSRNSPGSWACPA